MSRDNQVAPWVPAHPLVYVVGQSVGREEARLGRPFIGPAGQVLRGWLAEVGLDPDEDVAYTNVEMTYHPDEPNYMPTKQEIAAALPRVAEEIAESPSVRAVVLVGAAAAHMVFTGTMTLMQGRRGELASLPCWATWHPSYYLRLANVKRRAEVEGEVLATLGEVAEVARGGQVREVVLPAPRVVYETVVLT